MTALDRAMVDAWKSWHRMTDHRKYVPSNMEDLRWSLAILNGAINGDMPWSFSHEMAAVTELEEEKNVGR